jgi:hypothetical protein
MKYALAFLTGTLLLITALVAFSSQDLERLDVSGFENPRRPGAVFEHDLHNENAQLDDCVACHHLYEDGIRIEDESSEDSSCSECHLASPEPNNEPDNTIDNKMDNKITLQVAFHRQCKACHFEEKKGPVLCGECHIKN